MKLLHIDSSISGAPSISRQLSAAIVARLSGLTQGLEIVYRDLAANPVPHHSEALLAAKSGATEPAASVAAELALAGAALAEFLAADIVVIGAPMYNFGIPSQLKAWIDCLAVAGTTFSYGANGPQGLCGGKRVIVASSRGAIFSPPSPVAALEHQESYLSAFFGFLGTSVEFVRSEGSAYGVEQREQAIAAGLVQVEALAAA